MFPRRAVLLVLAFVATSCSSAAAETPLTGQEIFGACTNCHGNSGEGMAQFGAPAIAGLPAWYLEAQLQKFRGGLRAYHPNDVEGLRMRPMARTLKNDSEVKLIVAYVSQLSPVKAAASLKDGNAAAGKAAFGVCVACHGPNGGGNETMKAPPLVGQHDWYVASQLHKFKDGLRGTAPGDTTGAQMRPMAMTLADDAAIRDVATYLTTLSR